jgi:hypothetical protein
MVIKFSSNKKILHQYNEEFLFNKSTQSRSPMYIFGDIPLTSKTHPKVEVCPHTLTVAYITRCE